MRISFLATITALMLLLTSCANSNLSNDGSFDQDVSAAEDSLQGMWGFELIKTSEQVDEEPAPVCQYNLYDQWLCEFWFYVTNETKIPQEFDGYTYLVTDDGRIFESVEKPSLVKLNPGESRLETPSFKVPNKGIVATSIFRAWSATDNMYYQYDFPILWDLNE